MKTLEPPCPAITRNEHRVSTPPPAWLVIAAFGAVYLVWGSTYLGIRIAIATLPPLLMSGARFLIAGAVLYACMYARGNARPRLAHWRDATVVGGLLLLAGNGGVSWAEQTVPSNTAALVVASVPLWINLMDWLRPHGTRPPRLVFLGLLVGFLGVALIVLSRDAAGHRSVDPAGVAVLLLACFCWAVGSIFSRHASKPASALMTIAMQMICGGVLLILGGILMGEGRRLDLVHASAASMWAFTYLTCVGSLVGFTAYVWLLQVSTPARVSTYAYVNPLIAAVLGAVILHEVLPRGVALAGACILVAVVMITMAGKRRTGLRNG